MVYYHIHFLDLEHLTVRCIKILATAANCYDIFTPHIWSTFIRYFYHIITKFININIFIIN